MCCSIHLRYKDSFLGKNKDENVLRKKFKKFEKIIAKG